MQRRPNAAGLSSRAVKLDHDYTSHVIAARDIASTLLVICTILSSSLKEVLYTNNGGDVFLFAAANSPASS
jgi:hypothetical protein